MKNIAYFHLQQWSVGVIPSAGPSQAGDAAPSGGSAVHDVTSVGVL